MSSGVPTRIREPRSGGGLPSGAGLSRTGGAPSVRSGLPTGAGSSGGVTIRRRSETTRPAAGISGDRTGRSRALTAARTGNASVKPVVPPANSQQILAAKAALRTNQLNKLRNSIQARLKIRRAMLASNHGGGKGRGGPPNGGDGGDGEDENDPSRKIASGHAFSKHKSVLASVGINDQKTFEIVVRETIKNAGSGEIKKLLRGRTAYWNASKKLVVIHDPSHVDKGTAFVPANGRTYFEGLQ